MKTKKLILTGILGVVLAFVVIIAIGIVVMPSLYHQKVQDYRENELVRQFEITYPDSGIILSSGNLFEQEMSFSHSQNARTVSLSFIQGIGGESISYKCERKLPGQDVKVIFYFDNPTPQTIRDNVCTPHS
ncbi:MAG: hypothetical protein PVI88_00510 [Nitrosopumilaceae archaeon]|jgi:hypothetical protein